MNAKKPSNNSSKSSPTKVASKSPSKPLLKPRNPVANDPMMKKSHVHDKSKKTQRSQNKQALRKQLLDD